MSPEVVWETGATVTSMGRSSTLGVSDGGIAASRARPLSRWNGADSQAPSVTVVNESSYLPVRGALYTKYTSGSKACRVLVQPFSSPRTRSPRLIGSADRAPSSGGPLQRAEMRPLSGSLPGLTTPTWICTVSPSARSHERVQLPSNRMVSACAVPATSATRQQATKGMRERRVIR